MTQKALNLKYGYIRESYLYNSLLFHSLVAIPELFEGKYSWFIFAKLI